MNWIGGARNRLRGPFKNDLKAQKEYFERKRLLLNKSEKTDGDVVDSVRSRRKKSKVSQDVLAFKRQSKVNIENDSNYRLNYRMVNISSRQVPRVGANVYGGSHVNVVNMPLSPVERHSVLQLTSPPSKQNVGRSALNKQENEFGKGVSLFNQERISNSHIHGTVQSPVIDLFGMPVKKPVKVSKGTASTDDSKENYRIDGIRASRESDTSEYESYLSGVEMNINKNNLLRRQLESSSRNTSTHLSNKDYLQHNSYCGYPAERNYNDVNHTSSSASYLSPHSLDDLRTVPDTYYNTAVKSPERETFQVSVVDSPDLKQVSKPVSCGACNNNDTRYYCHSQPDVPEFGNHRNNTFPKDVSNSDPQLGYTNYLTDNFLTRPPASNSFYSQEPRDNRNFIQDIMLKGQQEEEEEQFYRKHNLLNTHPISFSQTQQTTRAEEHCIKTFDEVSILPIEQHTSSFTNVGSTSHSDKTYIVASGLDNTPDVVQGKSRDNPKYNAKIVAKHSSSTLACLRNNVSKSTKKKPPNEPFNKSYMKDRWSNAVGDSPFPGDVYPNHEQRMPHKTSTKSERKQEEILRETAAFCNSDIPHNSGLTQQDPNRSKGLQHTQMQQRACSAKEIASLPFNEKDQIKTVENSVQECITDILNDINTSQAVTSHNTQSRDRDRENRHSSIYECTNTISRYKHARNDNNCNTVQTTNLAETEAHQEHVIYNEHSNLKTQDLHQDNTIDLNDEMSTKVRLSIATPLSTKQKTRDRETPMTLKSCVVISSADNPETSDQCQCVDKCPQIHATTLTQSSGQSEKNGPKTVSTQTTPRVVKDSSCSPIAVVCSDAERKVSTTTADSQTLDSTSTKKNDST
ncbi:uncharacterized protein LOC131939211 [Physella acuta]|uniref:uncharacterized protein LOC131939211 n=1 Tax=Physella acuta TaxID=109671 RepID=UPI0027DE624E|nr:uncharacterized protein LOC131939211 [Physella acuta]